jgi:general secretion pathway protein I
MNKRGFTLLEVLVSVAILGLGLTAILSAQAGAFASAAHARNISVATGLLRCKMTEVEEHLYKEGFQDTDETGAGPCCEGDENPNMRCTWRADRPTFPEAKFGDLNLSSALEFGGGSSGGPGGPNPLGALGLLAGGGGPSPIGSASSIGDIAKTLADANAQAAAAGTPPTLSSSSSSSSGTSTSTDTDSAGGGMGGLASLAMSIVYPNLKTLFEASTRRITASLTFREGNKEHTIEVIEWFSVPQKGLAPTDDSSDAGVSATPAASATGTVASPAGTATTPVVRP